MKHYTCRSPLYLCHHNAHRYPFVLVSSADTVFIRVVVSAASIAFYRCVVMLTDSERRSGASARPRSGSSPGADDPHLDQRSHEGLSGDMSVPAMVTVSTLGGCVLGTISVDRSVVTSSSHSTAVFSAFLAEIKGPLSKALKVREEAISFPYSDNRIPSNVNVVLSQAPIVEHLRRTVVFDDRDECRCCLYPTNASDLNPYDDSFIDRILARASFPRGMGSRASLRICLEIMLDDLPYEASREKLCSTCEAAMVPLHSVLEDFRVATFGVPSLLEPIVGYLTATQCINPEERWPKLLEESFATADELEEAENPGLREARQRTLNTSAQRDAERLARLLLHLGAVISHTHA